MGVANLSDYRERKLRAEKPPADGRGFALLHRKIQECEFYRKDSQAVHLWVHLILSANHAPETVPTDYGDVVVERGQRITSAPKLEKETGIEEERVKYLLRKFKKLGMITTFSPGKFTLVTIVKYDEYQGDFTGKSFPQDSRNFPSANPAMTLDAEQSFPQDSRNFPTNNNITNNSLPNGNESPSAGCQEKPEQPNPEKSKSGISCEDVVSAYHEILPEAPHIRALNDKRKNKIRTFWKKAGVITRQLDGKPFSFEAWRAYLEYISTNCRWMLEERDNQRTGTKWHRKDLEYLLDDTVYLKVREGAHDDR